MPIHLRRLIFFPTLSIALIAALLAPAAATAATSPITFQMTIYGECVSGWARRGDLTVVWRDSVGALKAEGATTDRWEDGTWELCPTDAAATVMPGDKIKVSTEFATRKYVVPNLTISLDRVNDLALGTGPAGRTIRLCSSWSWLSIYADCRSVRIGQDGRWSFNPHTDIQGGTYAEISWKSPKGDHLFVAAYAPQIGVTIGKAGYSGWTDRLAGVAVSFEGSHEGSGVATADRAGAYAGVFRQSSNHPVSISAGDHLSAPSLAWDANWIVPTISGSANKQTDVVTGSCLNAGSDNRLRIWIVRPGGHLRGIGFWFTAQDGSFEADFTEYWGGGDVSQSLNIKSGDRVKIDCFLTTGDFARRSFVVP